MTRSAAEFHLTVNVRKYLQLAAPDLLFTHFPAGEARDERTGAKLKHMGLMPGWPDFIAVLPGGRLGCIELKIEGGKLSESQTQFRDRALALGALHVVCRSIEDVRQTLREWAVPTREAA